MIIAVAGQKGGSGKTTISCNLAAEAMRRKRSVLFIDADPQQTATEWVEDANERGYETPRLIHMAETMHVQLPEVSPNYDITIVDGPPRLYEVQRSIFMIADIVIIPCCHAQQDFRALAKMLPSIDEAKKIRPELKFYVVLNRVKTAMRGQEANDALIKSGMSLFKTRLGDRLDFQDAYLVGRGVTTYSPSSKAASEAQALYKEIMRRVK